MRRDSIKNINFTNGIVILLVIIFFFLLGCKTVDFDLQFSEYYEGSLEKDYKGTPVEPVNEEEVQEHSPGFKIILRP